jgi:hypothetical protein
MTKRKRPITKKTNTKMRWKGEEGTAYQERRQVKIPRDLGGYEFWPNNCESSERD